MKCGNYIKIEFPSKSANEALARSTVAAFAVQLDPTLDELGDIRTAVSEAVTNAIVHGYREKPGKIHMTLRIYADRRVVIIVRDSGCGIADLAQAMEPCFTSAPEEERSGMGFTVM